MEAQDKAYRGETVTKDDLSVRELRMVRRFSEEDRTLITDEINRYLDWLNSGWAGYCRRIVKN